MNRVGGDQRNIPPAKPTNAAGVPLHTKININKISSWYSATGMEEHDPFTSSAGLRYPGGTAGATWAAGLMWSGLHYDGEDPILRTNGNSYYGGLVQGAILGLRTGEIEDPEAPDVRIWRIRRDYVDADLTADAAEMNHISIDEVSPEQIEAVREQYQTDWLEWPAHKGAPFYDVDGDGSYSPSIVDGKPVLFPDADEPGVANADQVIWYVANDIGGRSPWGATAPPGLEMQVTIWAYASSTPLSDQVFKRYRLIYKGNSFTPDTAHISEMYLGQWSDTDVGLATDDFAGCDSILGLGYGYNGTPVDQQYADYGLPPPAIGYLMAQGPLLRGAAGEDLNRNGIDDAVDFALFDFRQTSAGFINLPAQSMIYCATPFPPYYICPGEPGYAGALQWNCVLQGLPGTPIPPPCPPPPTDPSTGEPAPRFWLYGDPSRGTGWIDGMLEGPGDRTIVLATGPFSLALGDTQEIIIAVAGGLGRDNLNSVGVMKKNANLARVIASGAFASLPGPPSSPHLQAHAYDRRILLDWEWDSTAIIRTEDSVVVGGYSFEGYKVYQFPDENGDMDDAILIAQFDVVNGITTIHQWVPDPVTGELFLMNVEYGSDNGILRTFAVSVDSLREGEPLVNGRYYYFGVSSYSYSPDTLLLTRTFESEAAIVTVQPETPKPGTRYPYSIGDTVSAVTQISGSSDALIAPVVYNPENQNGDVYQLLVDTTSSGVLAWNLTNTTSSSVVFPSIEDFTGEKGYRVQVGGYDLFVRAPTPGITGVVDGENEGVFGTLIWSVDGTLAGLGGTSEETGEDYEIRFGEESFALNARLFVFASNAVRVPFAVYRVGRGPEDPANEQVMVSLRDSSDSERWNLTPSSVQIGDSVYGAFEPIYGTLYDYVPDDPLTPIREDSVAVNGMRFPLHSVTSAYNTVPERSFYAAFVINTDRDSLPPGQGTVRFVKQHALRNGDEYQITLGRVTKDDIDLARNDISQIRAFPNPYYAGNIDETTSSGRFITFNHLPAKAVIRIYNLAGIYVRKLEKDDSATQYHRWDLRNEHNELVGSGIYVVYLELKDAKGVDLGTKVLKIAIIQGER